MLRKVSGAVGRIRRTDSAISRNDTRWARWPVANGYRALRQFVSTPAPRCVGLHTGSNSDYRQGIEFLRSACWTPSNNDYEHSSFPERHHMIGPAVNPFDSKDILD